jgi:hypothetical protein
MKIFAVAVIPISLFHLIIGLAYVLVVAMARSASRIAKTGWVPVAIPQPNHAPEIAPIDIEDAETTEEAHGFFFKPQGRNIDIVTRDSPRHALQHAGALSHSLADRTFFAYRLHRLTF